jgi:hypothetical protein
MYAVTSTIAYKFSPSLLVAIEKDFFFLFLFNLVEKVSTSCDMISPFPIDSYLAR